LAVTHEALRLDQLVAGADRVLSDLMRVLSDQAFDDLDLVGEDGEALLVMRAVLRMRGWRSHVPPWRSR
jgi:hypothetical protein